LRSCAPRAASSSCSRPNNLKGRDHGLGSAGAERPGARERRGAAASHQPERQGGVREDRVSNEQELDKLLEEAIRDTLNGTRVAFAIVDKASGELAGSTSYGNLFAAERKLEIGWSWLGRAYRGTKVNRATKALLLEYAFETLGCERVEFKTDVLNLRARRGLSAIGATEEGVLRSFNYMPGGRRRDAIFYSILKHEWPAIRERR
jgi:RimJ/RimL family protein N-acetyltransferase